MAHSEQRSLFGEILDWMLAPLLLLWPMSVAITWLVAQSIANHPYDRELAQMARTLARHVTLEAGAPKPKLDALAAELLRSDDVDQIWYQVLGLRGELVGGDRDLPTPAEDERVAADEVHFRDDTLNGEPVRVASLWLSHAPLARDQTPPLVQVAETLDKRSRLATEIIKGVILPQFVILPLAVLLVWLALARGIAPLNELQRRIRSRESHDLSPIGEREAPEEVAPLVRAINDLLARLDQSMSRQKHFLADAATGLSGIALAAYVWAFGFTQRIVFLIAGLGVFVLTLVSPLNALADGYLFSAHMLQHILLLLIVPALFLMSLPRGVSLGTRAWLSPGPFVGWIAGVSAMWLWHARPLCNAAVSSQIVRALQISSLLLLGAIFWRQILAPRDDERLSPPGAVLYLFSACVACSILGILITFAPVSVCPIYAQPRADNSGIAKLIQVNWGFTAEKDQQIGGLLMWVPMCFVYLTAIIAQLARWFAYPVTRTALTDNTL